MRKKVQKIIGIMLVVIASCFCGLTGCKGKYDDMTLEVSANSIELFLGETDNDGKTINNTAEFTATVGGTGEDISKELTQPALSTSGVVSVTQKSFDEETGKTTYVVSANDVSTEPVVITVRTKEGNKTAAVNVTVIKRITGMSANGGAKQDLFAVVGETKNINTISAITFEPNDTNQKDGVWTISNKNGHEAEITENGDLLVTKKNGTNPLELTFTSSVSGITSVKVNVQVVNPIKTEDIKLMLDEETEIESYYKWQVLDLDDSDMRLQAVVDTNEEYTLSASVTGETKVISASKETDNQIDYIQLNTVGNTGTNTLTVTVTLNGYNYTASKNIKIQVARLPKEIKVNGEDLTNKTKTYDIYDKYQNNLGQRFVIEIDQDATDRDYKIVLSSTYTEDEKAELDGVVRFCYDTGDEIKLGDVISYSTNIIYIKALKTKIEVKFDIIPVANEGLNDIKASFALNLAQGVGQNGIYLGTPTEPIDSEETLNLELNENDEYTDFNFYINADEYSSKFDLVVSNDTIIYGGIESVRFESGVNEKEYIVFTAKIKPLKEGLTSLTVTSDNNVRQLVNIRIIKTVDAFTITTESPLTNSNIADNGSEMYSLTEFGEKTLNRIIINSKTKDLKFNIVKFAQNDAGIYKQVNAKIAYQNVEYETGEQFTVVQVHDSEPYGYISARRVGTSKIKITVGVYTLDGEVKDISQEFEIITFIPVERIELTRKYVELIDTNNMLNYQDYLEQEVEAIVYPRNATLSYTDSDGAEHDFANISWTSGNSNVTLNVKDSTATIKGNEIIGTGSSRVATITASLTQFSKVYNVSCEVVVRKATLVTEIGNTYIGTSESNKEIINPVTIDGELIEQIYIDARDGITSQKYSLWTDVYPQDATFKDSEYIYLPSLADYTSGLYKTKPVLTFTDNTFAINRAGVGKVLVVSKDSISKDYDGTSLVSALLNLYAKETTDGTKITDNIVDARISDYCQKTSQVKFKLMYVKVADGKSEATAINISTVSDLVEINSLEGLDKYYIQTEDIDVSSKSNFEPIGSLNNIGFNGNYNGNDKTIKNVRFDFKERSNDEYSTALFSKIGKDSVVKNLNVTIQYMNIEVVNGNSLNVMLAGITVTNNGTIDNCKVTFKSSNLEINTSNLYFGGLVAINNGIVANSKTSGNINIARIGGEKTAVGGLVGENASEGKVSGKFALDFSSKQMEINKDYDVDAVITIDIKSAPSILNGTAYGGIVGLNKGTIKQVSSKAVIKSKTQSVGYISNVGGIAGVNNGTIGEVLSYSSISGQSNVGGIVGTSNGGTLEKVYTLLFEEYDIDDNTHKDDYIKIRGEENVGGIVGYATSTTISYAMVRSYVKRSIGDAFVGDMQLLTETDKGSYYAGGIAGNIAQTTISNSFAYLTQLGNDNGIIGGLVGSIDTDSQISNCYSRGMIYNTSSRGKIYGAGTSTNIVNVYSDVTGDDANFVSNDLLAVSNFASILGKDFDANSWLVGTSDNAYTDFNDGLPMVKIGENAFILQEPKSLELSFANDNQFEQGSKSNTISGTHKILDADGKKALLFYYSTDSANKIDISSLFSTKIVPENATNSVRYTSSNTSVAKIENNQLVVVGVGSATITCTSLLNNQAFDSVNIVVVNAVTKIDVYSDVEHKNGLDNLDVIKGQSKEIYFGSDSNTTVNYKISAITDINGIKINGKTILANSPITLTSNDSVVIEGVSKTEAQIIITPYFEIEGQIVEVGLCKNFIINVKNGISNISAEFNEADISQKDTFQMNLDITSDCDDSELEVVYKNPVENSIIYEKNSDGVLEEKTDLKLARQGTTNTYNIVDGENVVDSLELDLSLSNVQNGTSIATISISKAPVNYQVDFEIEFIVQVKNGGEDNDNTISKSCNFVLNILQQPVHFVNVEFYSYAEQDASGVYNVNEVPTSTILAGKIGLLKIDLYPDFAGIDRVEVEYKNFGYTVDMQQMIYKGYNSEDINKSSYEMLNMATPKISNGIVFDQSYDNILSKKDGSEYSFDGYLYAYVLIPSLASTTGSITFDITTYCSNGDIVKTSKTLSIDLPSEVDMTFNGDYNAFVAKGYNYQTNLTVRTTQLMKSASDDANLSIYARVGTNSTAQWQKVELSETGASVGDYTIAITKSGVSTLSYNKKTYTTVYTLKISGNIGETIQLRAGYTTLVNNQSQTYYTAKNLSLKLVDYTVDSFELEGANAGVFEKLTGSQYSLNVKLKTTSAEDNDVSTKITALENALSICANTWYALRRDMSMPGTPYAYLPLEISTNSTETSPYAYFRFLEIKDDSSNRTAINIAPSKESLTEVLQAVVAVKYENGEPTAIDSSENYLAKYSSDTYDYDNNSVYLKNRWSLRFIYNNSSDKPNPIATYEQFQQMVANKNYRLVNDIVINEKFTPLTTEIAGLDGNGFTIYLTQGFDLTSQKDDDTLNVGLFATVSENTVLKNIKLSIKYLIADTIDLTQITDEENNVTATFDASMVNFGYIAGVNNGTIYNCEVIESGKDLIEHGKSSETTTNGTTESQSTGLKQRDNYLTKAITIKTNILNSSNSTVETYIGGITGKNNGSLTHSRAELRISANRGYVGGIAGYNNGAIASSFYKLIINDVDNVGDMCAVAIKNEATTEVSNQTAGFVAINDSDGTIKLSYSEGYKIDSDGYRYENGKVSSSANASGFVVTNKGLIENCYSNIPVVSEKRSCGFVFSNEGQVKKCYSASLMIQNSSSHTAFTGTNDKNFANVTSTSVMEDCCYFTDNNKNILCALNEQANEQAVEDLSGFSFRGEGGDWNYLKYKFTPTEQTDNLKYEVTVNGFGWTSITVTSEQVGLPTLVDANIIAIPHIAIAEIDDDNEDEKYKWKTDYDGSWFNPLTINSASEFNAKIVKISENLNNFSKYFRIINDITFSTSEKPTTTDVDFSGYICGNGFTISGIAMSADSGDTKKDRNDYGLFARVVGDKNKYVDDSKEGTPEHNAVTASQLATIKDLTIQVEYLSANQAKCVGVLAGSLIDAYVFNIAVDGEDAVIQGMNFVGGLAGQIVDGDVKNVTSNVSVNAGKYLQQAETYLYDLSIIDSSNGAYKLTNYENQTMKYSYAGAIAGVAVSSAEVRTTLVKNITVQGSSIVANHAGLAFGLLGEQGRASYVTAIIDDEQYIRATATAGGLVAENRGLITCSCVYYENGTNSNFFSGSPKVIGGLVGFNYGGSINYSYSQIDAKNSACTIAGGLVGTTVGGLIHHCYSTGDVDANHVCGGLIGSYLKEKHLIKSESSTTESSTEKESNTGIIYMISKHRFEDSDSAQELELFDTLSLHDFDLKENLNNGRRGNVVFGAVIGAIDCDDITEVVGHIFGICYIYYEGITGCYYVGKTSNTPNGTGGNAITKINKACFTNEIEGKEFTSENIEKCSSYYKSIFSGWSHYFDIASLSITNKYPKLLQSA